MSPEDLRVLAVDIAEGRVFGTWNLRESEVSLIPMIFLPVALGAFNEVDPATVKDQVFHLYEYMDRALPRSINGKPIFPSVRVMSRALWEQIDPLLRAYTQMRDQFVSPR